MKKYLNYSWNSNDFSLRTYIQKFPDWVDNEINNNTRWEATQRVMAAKSQNDTTAPSGRELCHLQFSLHAASLEMFGHTPVYSKMHATLYSQPTKGFHVTRE
jgi:hypothetical protein